MRVITLATLTTMPRARVLARSLARHEPGWPLEVLLVAGEEVVAAVRQREAERADPLEVRSASQELELDVEMLLARYQHEDLTALLLPRILRRSARGAGEPVMHLPSSAWVVGALAPLERELAARSVLLVPRMSSDVPDDGLEPSRAQMEAAGRIDETIMAVDGTGGAEGFLVWWGQRVEEILGSLDARRSGARPEDRGWLARLLELAPARFATAVLEDPGCNLNMWNLQGHTLEDGPDGVLVDGRCPARFLNLPGFDPDRPYRLNAMASRVRVSRSPALHELCERYAEQLRAAGWHNSEHREDVGRRLADGLVYDDSLRAMHAAALALGEPLEDPFSEAGTRAFLAWLLGPAPRGGALGINRYVFHRVARERPDVIRTYPDIDGEDGPGFLAWCRAFGVAELAIPERFMPRGAAAARARSRECLAPGFGDGRAPGARCGADGRGPGGEADGIPRAHARPGRCRAGLRAGARRRRRAREHGERAAAPPGAAGGAGGGVRPARLRGRAPSRAPRLRDRGRQRRRAPGLRGAPGRGLLPGAAHRHLGMGDEHDPGALAGRVRAGGRDLGVLALHGREHRRGGTRPGDRAAAAGAGAGRVGRPAAPGRPRGLPVPVRVRLPEHDPAQEPRGPDRGVQAGVRARGGSAAVDQDDQRSAAAAGRGAGAVGGPRTLRHPPRSIAR